MEMMNASNLFAYLAETINLKKTKKNKKNKLKTKKTTMTLINMNYQPNTQIQRNIMSYKLLARQDELLKCLST